MKRLLRHPAAQAALSRTTAWFLRLALARTRWEVDGMAHVEPQIRGEAAIFAFWHEVLPLMPVLAMIGRELPGYQPAPVHILVSRHGDGRFLASVLRHFDLSPVHGSSSRGGTGATIELTRLLRAGAIIAITPDGPRGPARVAAPGVAFLAGAADVPVIPCAAVTRRGFRVNSAWDRMRVPLPWGRGVVCFGTPIRVTEKDWETRLPEINAALTEAVERAERLCPC
jgi:lysophospholipid acyltransferase (LPLAT)-like uncharacterized protein